MNMDLAALTSNAKIKGLNLLGTGDALHPRWLQELKEGLEEVDDSGVYRPIGREDNAVTFIARPT